MTRFGLQHHSKKKKLIFVKKAYIEIYKTSSYSKAAITLSVAANIDSI
jgi:hypothetical protein